MAHRYNLEKDFFRSPIEANSVDPNYLQYNGHWILAVVRMGRPVSFSRATNKSIGPITDGALTRKEPPLIITDDCIEVTTSASKRSHTKMLNATLKHGKANYLRADMILPGDWVFCWMMNNEETYRDVLSRVVQRKEANRFDDGLKFAGRVHSIQRIVSSDPGIGKRLVNYRLSCVGFDELDTSIFYDFALANAADQSGDIGTFMSQLGLRFEEIVASTSQLESEDALNNSGDLISALINLILGKGISGLVNKPTTDAIGDDTTIKNEVTGEDIDISSLANSKAPQATKEAPFAYLVPKTVGALFGRPSAWASKGHGIFSYADILESVIGVQSYIPPSDPEAYRGFVPELNTEKSTKSRKFTTIDLRGTFTPINLSFVNVPVWKLLHQYLNSSINEIYTALKVNEDGLILPTIVARQIPFTTESFAEDIKVTRFMELPRWILPPVMVQELTVGRSNATRTNMVHLYGADSVHAAGMDQSRQLILNPPIYDALDIQRNGVRGIIETVNCDARDIHRSEPLAWMKIIADRAMGSQFTLNGAVSSYGIQSPIAEGDNVEIEGIVYHIESVSHNCKIQPSGRKTFRTTLQLSYGLEAIQGDAIEDFPRYPGFRNIAINKEGYTYVEGRDEKEDAMLAFDPGHTHMTRPQAFTENTIESDESDDIRLVSTDEVFGSISHALVDEGDDD